MIVHDNQSSEKCEYRYDRLWFIDWKDLSASAIPGMTEQTKAGD